jgi:CRP-like cAMP-binding protein
MAWCAAINGHAFGQMTVQQDGAALTMPRAKFVDAYLAHPHLRNLVERYQAILLTQAQQNAACHALHSVRSRLCRWLLQSQDMIGSDTFSLTQEFLSHMLGVRRNTVSIEAHAVQQAGLIRYSRGHITILNRDGSPYVIGRSRHWIKNKNPQHPAVKREAEEDWNKRRWR